MYAKAVNPAPNGHRPPRKRAVGFTLVELLAVVAIIAIAAGMILPQLMGRGNPRALRQAARELLVAARFAHEYALTHGCACRLVLNARERGYVLLYQDDSDEADPQFKPIPMSAVPAERLPAGISFGRLNIEPGIEREQAQDNIVTFDPSGTADAASIELTNGQTAYWVVVMPATGRSDIQEHNDGSAPNDREDLDA